MHFKILCVYICKQFHIFQSEDEISNFQNKILQDRKATMADNISLVVFSPEKSDGTTESDLIEALRGKYDALKDKLMAEALMKEVTETKVMAKIWANIDMQY